MLFFHHGGFSASLKREARDLADLWKSADNQWLMKFQPGLRFPLISSVLGRGESLLLRNQGSLVLNRTMTYNWWFGLGLGNVFKPEIGLSTDPDTFKHAISSAGLVLCCIPWERQANRIEMCFEPMKNFPLFKCNQGVISLIGKVIMLISLMSQKFQASVCYIGRAQ